MKMTKSLLIIATVGAGLMTFAQQASAHGYVMQPESRAYKGTNKIGLNTNVGQAQWEPQSIEAPKGFPNATNSPKDGKIASGDLAAFSPLDEQNQNRWHKSDITTGKLNVTWFLTAQHRTEKWTYFMTKQGWNPNEPLKRDSLEKITTKLDNGAKPNELMTQEVNIPTDRSGYHVIVAVWDIYDTANAFYQVMDVNVKGSGEIVEDKEAPTTPQKLAATHTAFNQVSLAWDAATDNVAVTNYEILRDGKVIGETKGLTFSDTTVAPNTNYNYQIRALDAAGNKSALSANLAVKTPVKPVVDTEKPTIPGGLIPHMTTDTSTMIHWTAATDNVGVSHYLVLRNGSVVGNTKELMYTDKDLTPATAYVYQIVAVDAAGNKSDASAKLTITTKEAEGTPETNWEQNKTYVGGEVVRYNGLEYKAQWWTKGDKPSASGVWKLMTPNVVTEWNTSMVYNGGDKVTFNKVTYQAKWWTQGEKPGNAAVWSVVK
ncbi:lytic polysaccharide monooxygenase [Carnobacterium sp.]|uniref:lytic polysaccharide monooxygenase n=1 Tax=Carnobacterium sp. TaxID=48221 RepID=UPI002FC86DCB